MGITNFRSLSFFYENKMEMKEICINLQSFGGKWSSGSLLSKKAEKVFINIIHGSLYAKFQVSIIVFCFTKTDITIRELCRNYIYFP